MGEFAAILMSAPALADLSRSEIAAIERAARVVECAPGELLCPSHDQDRRLFVLVEGEMEVRLCLREGEHCGGEARVTLDRPGEVLGWALLMKRERLSSTARCVTPSRLLAVDLGRLPSQTGLALAKRLAFYLHGQMQQLRLCPRRLSRDEAV